MNASPKPAPPKPRPVVLKEEVEVPKNPEPKKPFIPTTHLESYPFRDSEALRELQKQMRKDNPPAKRSVRPTRGATPKKEKK